MTVHVVTEDAQWDMGIVDLSLYQLRDEKGIAGGYASLDPLTGTVPEDQLPTTITPGDFGGFTLSTQAGPFAVHGAEDGTSEYDATSNQTFVSFYGTDYSLMVASFDHATRQVVGPVRVCAPPSDSAEDAHGVPSLAIDDNGRIHVIFGPHGTLPRYVRSTNPRDITSWTVTDLSVGLGTYHTLVWEPTTGALYASFRAGSIHVYQGATAPDAHEYGTFIRSLDRGTTWTQLSAAGTPNWINTSTYDANQAHDFYAYGAQADGQGGIHITWTIATGAAHDGERHDVFHVIFNASTLTYRTMSGTDLGPTVNTQSELLACRVTTSGVRDVHRMVVKSDGEPVFVYHDDVTDAGVARAAVKTARWTGSSWATSDTGGRTHYNYHYPGIVEMENGDLLVLAITGRTDRAKVGNPLDEAIVYTNIGGDVNAYRSTDDGATWVDEGKVIDGHKVRGPGIAAVSVPRRARSALLAIACASVPSFPPNNLSAMRLSLYGIGASINRDATLEQDPGTSEQLYPPQLLVAQTTAPSTGTWTTLSLQSKLPQNATAVRLRASLRGGGAGPVTITLRIKGTTSAGLVEFGTRGDWTDDNVFEVWCPITPNVQLPSQIGAQLEWKWSGAGTLAQAGWWLSGVRYH